MRRLVWRVASDPVTWLVVACVLLVLVVTACADRPVRLCPPIHCVVTETTVPPPSTASPEQVQAARAMHARFNLLRQETRR